MSVIETVACWINYHAFGAILDLVVQRILPILSGTRSATWHWPCFTSTASYGYSTTLFCARSGISFRYYYWRLELRWYNLANRTTKPFRPDWFRLGSPHHWVHYASFARLSMFDRSSSPDHLYDCHTQAKHQGYHQSCSHSSCNWDVLYLCRTVLPILLYYLLEPSTRFRRKHIILYDFDHQRF